VTSPQPVQRVEPESLSSQAYKAILHANVGGRMAMGEQLVETSLEEHLGVCRPPIRQALHRLAQEGLVVERPRRGAFVRTIDADDFVDLCNARMGVESICARLIVNQRKETDEVSAQLPMLIEAARAEDSRDFVAADMAFHLAMCRASGNAHLVHMFQSLMGQVRLALGEIQRERKDLEAVAEGHAGLVEILSSGSEQAASSAFQEHVRTAGLRLVTRLGGNGSRMLHPLSS
jgi:DNA-binding GntR family transcriptional regulator